MWTEAVAALRSWIWREMEIVGLEKSRSLTTLMGLELEPWAHITQKVRTKMSLASHLPLKKPGPYIFK